MNLVRSVCFALIAGCFALPAMAECTAPVAPAKVPDGTSAAEAEMVAAMQTLKRYDTDVNTYVKCLEFEAKQNRLSREEQARRHNQIMDSLTQIAAKFNEQVRVFKSKAG
jgi:Tfp pilus assembly protein PilE